MGGVTVLLDEAHRAGLTIQVDGDRLAVRGPRSAEALARRVLDLKADVMAAMSGQLDKPIDWWQHITDEDREYLTTPRNWPDPCLWCGGRLRHNPMCVVLTWEPVLAFGRHKGKRLSKVPKDYLLWLLAKSTNINARLRTEIEEVVRGRGDGITAA